MESLIATAQDYYKPLATVELVNEHVKVPTLRLAANWGLLIVSVLFLATGFIAIKNKLGGNRTKVLIKLYLLLMVVMFVGDTVAVIFETSHVVNDKSSLVGSSSWIKDRVSLIISIVIGFITLGVIRNLWGMYTKGQTVARVSFTLLIFKMLLAAAIAVYSTKQLTNDSVL